MNKNAKVILGLIVLILIVVGVVWYRGSRSGQPGWQNPNPNGSSTDMAPAPVVPVSETTKSGKTTEYHNAELGFSVKYPSAWEKIEQDTGVSFVMPIDKTQVSTVAKLQSDVVTTSGKCAFPPVTTIKERKTVAFGTLNFNMISMSNNVQGRDYFNRMYSLQKDSICYLFTFSSITQSAASKNLTGSNLTQAQNNNKAIVTAADESFTDLVKTFAFVAGPQGVDETKAPPVKK